MSGTEVSPQVGEAPDDIVADVLQRIAIRAKLPADVLAEIDREIRKDWGGERPYIAKGGERERLQRSVREMTIRAEHRRGDHVGLLARRWGYSVRRIQQIIRG